MRAVDYSERTKDATPQRTGSRVQRCGALSGPDCPCHDEEQVQPKLTLGPANDRFEQEADRIASRIVASSPLPHGADEPPRITPVDAATPTPGAPTVDLGPAWRGRPLSASTRTFMEQRFAADFSNVRIHDNSRAAETSAHISARAFTHGTGIWLGAGQTDNDLRLMAHELTHVIQQGGTAPRSWGRPQAPSPAHHASAPASHDDTNGGASSFRPVAQRRVRETVVPYPPQPGAQACMVHLHGNEENALRTGQELHRTHCANLVHLTSTTRNITVERDRATFRVDPNRIFTQSGLGAVPATARQEVRQWRDQNLGPAISRCRMGSGSADMSGPLPVVALHNNTPDRFSIQSYDPGRNEAGATETRSSVLGSRANPSRFTATGNDPHSLGDPDNFLLVTDPADFDALRGRFNVVLQKQIVPAQPEGPHDDGSLSVALAGERYVNVESEGKPFVSIANAHFVTNKHMALAVLGQLGVRERPCQPASSEGAAMGVGRAAGAVAEGAAHAAGRIQRQAGRATSQRANMPDAFSRERVPTSRPDCLTFVDESAALARKRHWTSTINSMLPADVVNWVIGVSPPPRQATAEAEQQRNCMLEAMRSSRRVDLPRTRLRSGYRGFDAQNAIWSQKFGFTRAGTWGRITPEARNVCSDLLRPDDVQWRSGRGSDAGQRAQRRRHLECWERLDVDQRQREILQTSSAPGISRHHWGSDFDLFGVTPQHWERGRVFADEYSWMRRNASTYGFLQSFTQQSAGGRGYMEERWHWSYFPIADALVDFVRANQQQVETALLSRWGTAPMYSYIRANWRDYMFNVNRRLTF